MAYGLCNLHGTESARQAAGSERAVETALGEPGVLNGTGIKLKRMYRAPFNRIDQSMTFGFANRSRTWNGSDSSCKIERSTEH
jgi:hypothetical protein